MGFEQAGIAVQSAEFTKLKDIVERAFTTDANRFLGAVESNGMLVRQFEEILNKGLFTNAPWVYYNYDLYNVLCAYAQPEGLHPRRGAAAAAPAGGRVRQRRCHGVTTIVRLRRGR